jgi:hypothetical protein
MQTVRAASGSWVYLYSKEDQLWTVGFYKPDGQWFAESDHASPGAAAARVHYLNGGKVDVLP